MIRPRTKKRGGPAPRLLILYNVDNDIPHLSDNSLAAR
jgi:hypothetical protein